MDNKEFGAVLEKRTRKFAVTGANYREANRSGSKADFKSKIRICESEASETQYWLEVIVEAAMLTWEQVKTEHQECSELLAIFTSIAAKR